MPTDWIAIALEEYRTLRQEWLQAARARHAIAGCGLLLISALLALAVAFWREPVPAALLLLLFCPLFCYLPPLVWLGETARMLDAAHGLGRLEERIGARFPGEVPPLSWSSRLPEPPARVGVAHVHRGGIAVVLLFLLAAPCAVLAGHLLLAERLAFARLLWIDGLEAACWLAAAVHIARALRALGWRV